MASNLYDVAIPEVSAEDNGKVLSVVGGKWEKTSVTPELPELPEEDGAYILTATIDKGEATITWEVAPEGGE